VSVVKKKRKIKLKKKKKAMVLCVGDSVVCQRAESVCSIIHDGEQETECRRLSPEEETECRRQSVCCSTHHIESRRHMHISQKESVQRHT
jgi:hypothetical protein